MSDAHGAIVRGDSSRKALALLFSGDEFAEGTDTILKILNQQGIRASFFLTGRFLDNKRNHPAILNMKRQHHYIGAHSDGHLLYCDWNKRDSLLIDEETFHNDLNSVYKKLGLFGVEKEDAVFFLPPYEWYNKEISRWTRKHGLQLINFTAGTLTTADYTFPSMGDKYRTSDRILNSVSTYMEQHTEGLNGFMMLIHLGTDPQRRDKFYNRLPFLLEMLRQKGYQFERVDKLLAQ